MPKLIQNLKPIIEKDDTIKGFEQFQSILLSEHNPNPDDINIFMRLCVMNQKKQFMKYYKLLIKYIKYNVELELILISSILDVKLYDSMIEKKTLLMTACENKRQEIVQILANDPKINFFIQDSRNRNALNYAVNNKNKATGQKFVRILLSKCPQLLAKCSKMNNPLAQAINGQKVDIVRAFLQYEIQPNSPIGQNGNTALHECFRFWRNNIKYKQKINAAKQMIQLLVQKGADPYIKNEQTKDSFQNCDQYAEQFQKQYLQIKKNLNNNISQLNNQRDKENKGAQPILVINNADQRQAIFSEAETIFNKYKNLLHQQSQQYQSSSLIKIDTTAPQRNNNNNNNGISFAKAPICDPFCPSQNFLTPLNKQIQIFTRQCIADHQSARKDLDQFISYISPIVNRLGFSLDIYGSYATGLWVNHCDIDIILIPRQSLQAKFLMDYLQYISDKLKKNTVYQKCSIAKNSKIPLLRIQVADENKNNGAPFRKSIPRKLDISILSPINNGRQHKDYVLQLCLLYPQIKPLFFIIKKLTHHYRLYDPTRSGVRSFALFLMLVIFMQQQTGSQSLAQLLVKFLYKFGYQYQYDYEQANNYNSAMILNLPDPVNVKNNIGKNTDASALQRMFKTAYIMIHTRQQQQQEQNNNNNNNKQSINRIQRMFQSRDMFPYQPYQSSIPQQIYNISG